MKVNNELPFCLCGCGGRVTKKENRWIVGHNRRKDEKIRHEHKTQSLYSKTEDGIMTIITCVYNLNTNHITISSSFKKSSGNNDNSKSNKSCSSYLGIYISERILSHIYSIVERMSYNNPGYDFICGQGYKIDVKSACGRKKYNHTWAFGIHKNTVADYFLCLAFDNREDLNPQHIWLIPGLIINDKQCVSISKSTIQKWKKYEQSLDEIISCCNILHKSK